ncbi:MAG TPA: serine hydrolase domain-containing protein [Thermoanaerobaculia bacterium]|nr:serine hydrolase domain-containing protein [Thermoanaerobaculia bacterium]
MRRILGLILGAALAATWPGRHNALAEQQVSLSDRIAALIEPQARADLFSGAVLVQRGDRVVFQQAYGFASREPRIRNAVQTRFGIGSITKPMTDAVVAGLVARHRIDPQAPVENYIPGFPRGPAGGKPTIDQLLKHTAGVPHRVTTEEEETKPFRPADIVGRVKARGLLFEPGSRELYSSAGYTSLARVVEIVTGRPFGDVLIDDVFRPARMTSAVSEARPRGMRRLALPCVLRAGKTGPVAEAAPYKDLRFLAGAGSAYAAPSDLVGFVRKVREGGFGEELRNWATAGEKDKWRGWYGRINGYEASLDLLPGQDLVLVMESNLQSAANWQLRRRIQDLLLGRSVVPVPLPPARAAGFEPPADVVGLYGERSDPVEVALRDGELQRDENQIYPIAGEKYYIPVSGFTMVFRRRDGKVDAIVTTFADGNERVLPRLAGP